MLSGHRGNVWGVGVLFVIGNGRATHTALRCLKDYQVGHREGGSVLKGWSGGSVSADSSSEA